MTDRPALLRQIHTEARPYVEQLVELNVVFTGFRKLATENGLDWGQIKSLLRAEIEDGLAGGSEKVDRIIKKAEWASEYATLLGLGSNMNECNSISETDPPHDPTTICEALDRAGLSLEQIDLSTGEIIEEQNPATVSGPVGVSASPEECAVPIQQAGPHDGGSHEVAPHDLKTFAKDTFENSVVSSGTDAGSDVRAVAQDSEPETAKPVTVGEGAPSAAGHQGDASLIPIPQPAADPLATEEPDNGAPPSPRMSGSINSDDPGPIPDFLRRVA